MCAWKSYTLKAFLVVIDAIFLARPVLWIPVWGFCAFGYCRALAGIGGSIGGIARGNDFVWMFVFSIAVGAVYILNQIADRRVDMMNKGFPLLVRGRIGLKTAYASAVLFGAASVALLWMFRPSLALFSAAALLLGILYSFKPVHFSGRPIADFSSNAVGYGGIAFGAGWMLAGGRIADSAFFISALPYLLLMASGSICSTLPDYDGDKVAGKKTTVVALGPRRAFCLATVIIIAACAAAFYAGDYIALAAGATALFFFIIYFTKRNDVWMEASYKLSGAIVMLLASFLYPVIIFPSLAALLATLLYFRIRHGVSYPSLLPVSNER